ncbi:MAG: carboxypeptidase regulatory-like domain-containing protein [Terriglobia bacterium]
MYRNDTFERFDASVDGRTKRDLLRWLLAGGLAAMICLAVFLPAPSLAQVFTGTVTGVVTDPSGAVVPGAKVTATDLEKGFIYSTTTNTVGRYTFGSLPPSSYKITFAAQGFQAAVRTGIALVVNENATVNVQMKLGGGTQAVTVTGAAPLLQAQDATTGQSVGRNLINDLPLVGRSVFDLAFLSPGVSPAPASVFGPNTMANNWVSNGGRNATADILLDGVTVTAPEQNTQFLNPLYTPSVDAVQEYKVEQNNFSADKGFSGNTVVNVILRSGTNQFHGSAYEFLRNSSMNANNWFNDRAGLPLAAGRNNDFGFTIGGPIQKNKTFFFGDFEGRRDANSGSFSAGVPSAAERNGDFGEICKDNGGTFNAAGACSAAAGQLWDPYSGLYNSSAGQRNLQTIIPFNNMAAYTSPGSPLLAGTAFQLPATAGNLINPVALKMLQYYPSPNLNVGTSAYNRFDNWAGTGASTDGSNQFDIKGDRQISNVTHFDARYSMVLGHSIGANPWNNPLNTDTQGPIQNGTDSAVLNLTHSFSPTLLLTASYGWTRFSSYTLGVDKSFPNFNPITSLGLPAYFGTSGINASPTIYIDGGYTYVGAESLGAQAWSVLHYALETHDLLASLDKMSGRHELKFGGEMRVLKDDFEQPGVPAGMFEFSQTGTSRTPNGGTGGDGLASFLTGVGGPGSWGQYEIPLTIATQNFEYSAYFQDNWHAASKLTLNLGVRYDLYMPSTERHNQQEWVNTTAANPLSSLGLSLAPSAAADIAKTGQVSPNLSNILGGLQFASSGNRYSIDPAYTDFSPRFGFAYMLPHNTVLRGGYGIFYSTPDYTAHGTGLGSEIGFLQDTGWLTTYQGNGYTPWGSLSNPFPATNATSANPFPNAIGGLLLPPGSSQGLSTDLGTGISGYLRSWNQVPYEQTWNFGIQHQFGGVLVDAEYVGTKGTHLYYAQAGGLSYFGPSIESATPAQIQALNAYVPNPFSGVITTPGCGICGGTVQASQLTRPYPEFNGFGGVNPPWANSEYNALQLRVEKKFSHGLEVLANYTWEKTLDDASVSGSNTTWLGGTAPVPQDPNNLRAEYALSEYDIPQVLTFSYVYQLPFGRGQRFGAGWNGVANAILGGWQTQGLWRIDDGQPLELTSNSSTPLPTYGAQRPDLTGRLKVNNCSETCFLNQYFANPQVAQEPANYTLGTAPRVSNVYAFGTNDADLSVFKEIPIKKLGEGGRAEVRIESFNTLNHVQFGRPNTVVGQGSFGQITGQANTPRELQLGLKLYW